MRLRAPFALAAIYALTVMAPAQDVGGAVDLTGMGIYGMEDAVMEAARGGSKGGAKSKTGKTTAGKTTAVKTARLTFTPSLERRRQNYAAMVAQTRTRDPKAADEMKAAFAKTDLVAALGKVVAPLGFRTNSLSDAYALWLVAAYSASQGKEVPTDRTTLAAVRAQIARALGSTAGASKLTDAQKQRAAEAFLVHAVFLDGAAERAKGKPEEMKVLMSAARQGAKASGIDLDALTLTTKGFVAK